jgi:hypothetical protein
MSKMRNQKLARKVWRRIVRHWRKPENQFGGYYQDFVYYEESAQGGAISFENGPNRIWVLCFLPDHVELRGRWCDNSEAPEIPWQRKYDATDLMQRIGEELINLGWFPSDYWPDEEVYGPDW